MVPILTAASRDRRVTAAAAVEEGAVVGSTATTTIRTTGSRLLTTSSHGHLRLKQALTAKLTPTNIVSITNPCGASSIQATSQSFEQSLTHPADGGYQNYLALWYQSLAAQQANAGQGEAPKPPGTS